MKVLFILLAAAVMWLSTRLPFEKTDVAQLLPVNLFLVEMVDGRLCVSSDKGDVGIGDTLEEALEDMEQTASGMIFYDTVEYVLLGNGTNVVADTLGEYFRPGTFLCGIEGEVEPESAAAYLRSRRLHYTLMNMAAEEGGMPKLREMDGRYYYGE